MKLPTGAIVAGPRAGWSIGETAIVNKSNHWIWVVSGHNGENLILAIGATQDEAWRRAVEQAREVGMLGRLPG